MLGGSSGAVKWVPIFHFGVYRWDPVTLVYLATWLRGGAATATLPSLLPKAVATVQVGPGPDGKRTDGKTAYSAPRTTAPRAKARDPRAAARDSSAKAQDPKS